MKSIIKNTRQMLNLILRVEEANDNNGFYSINATEYNIRLQGQYDTQLVVAIRKSFEGYSLKEFIDETGYINFSFELVAPDSDGTMPVQIVLTPK